MATASYLGVSGRRVSVQDLRDANRNGQRWAMLTAYDYTVARVFDDAGIPVLLVGDSAANVVYGYDTTMPVTVDELIPLVRGVARGTRHALVVADLPFGSYESTEEQAFATAVRLLQSGANAVKLEGGEGVSAQVEAMTSAGVPVMGHLGVTPQAVNMLSGYRVQGRGNAAATQMLRDALALQAAGAFAVVLEVVPGAVAARITAELAIPTIGIGAGNECDAQVLVWQDMAGLRAGAKTAKFVKQYADLDETLGAAAKSFADDVRNGVFPSNEHSYE